ncbi:nuclear transport factor 2 family protein [Cronbergia sp. UHCC 0137]|uniref:nuclear transport factor 2 family protein n=1 Tax=Cronbergia sp. UHCC 0137 TaxID=3110239 RepID=UPI002B1EF32F|nr:nuclear transport factor 2 family protein [Cronbergia sp. UHCC 0137]MEA5619039.1 nuclear transport factor 2 family protein [Cronbergia sp. UHCC 0137]
MKQEIASKNAVLDDQELQKSLKQINPKFGDFLIRVAGEAWSLPLIDQKTKALIAIAIHVVNQDHLGSGSLFASHVNTALQQGASPEEIEELLLFLCVYAGFNKVAACFPTLNLIFAHINSTPRTAVMLAQSKKATNADYSARDQKGKVAFYVLLWKRQGISLDLFDNYWKDVHGPVCARLPGQYQYWQFHVAHNQGGFCPQIPGLDYSWDQEDNFDGIAELTFESESDRHIWFKASSILMDDEHNLFRKAIGYNSSPGNSITYKDGIPTGDPNGDVGAIKFHVMVKKADGVSTEAFRQYLTGTFARHISNSDALLKFRLHLFEEVDNSRPDAAGVSHYEPPAKQYHAAYEIAFANHLEREKFFASSDYARAIQDAPKYIRQIQPFPERTAYTFVYDGQMTLAGQRSAKVADLITKIGAANQINNDIVSLMIGGESNHTNGNGASKNGHDYSQYKQQTSSDLGHLLQGVQHVGVTVEDMNKSLEFYTEVLGGKLVVSENQLVGDVIQNTLFQKEELEAYAQNKNLQSQDLPQLRSGKEDALDVKFISFGNTVVELIYFRDAGKLDAPRSSVSTIPSHIGHVNAMHISFNVKEGVDLSEFAKALEEKCRNRGMNNVICNRIVHVKSEAERRAVALRYNSFKFWNEPESLAAGEPEIDWSHDPMEGWSLFYCKGPNGEQLEFNQVTRKVKTSFQTAMEEYNQANGTSFTFPDNIVGNGKSHQLSNGKLDHQQVAKNQIQFTFSIPVNADWENVWNVVLDKIENTSRYNPEAQNPQILARYSDGMMRQMNALGMIIKERITINKALGSITHTLVDNPYFQGQIINQVVRPTTNAPSTISYTLNWEPLNEEGHKIAGKIQEKLYNAMQQSVLSAKEFVEKQKVAVITDRKNLMKTKLPGTNTDLVKRLFSRGEAFDSEGFVTFFTDTPVYQFGNFDVCLDKASIKKSADAFFSQIDAVYHEIKMIWEAGDVVFVEMDVAYWRKDGSMISLPCSDIFRVEGDKFSELRIFMDVNPVFNPRICVPQSASVLTISKGQEMIAPGTMRRHFAEHPEGKERVAQGFVPKWAIAGPKWSIGTVESENGKASPEQLKVVGELSAAIMAEEWEKVKTYLTDDLLYKVGSGEPMYGPNAVVDFFKHTFKNTAKFYGHDARKIWIEPDIITIEMDAKYEMVGSKKHVKVACCDIYRMRGNKVSEWRVYADMTPWQS